MTRVSKRTRNFKPTRTASPTLRLIFDAIDRSDVTQKDLGKAASIPPVVLSYYRAGRREPGVMTVEALVHALGYRLVLEPINTPDLSEVSSESD